MKRCIGIMVACLSGMSALGCAWEGETVGSVGLAAEVALPQRRGTLLADGCVLDPQQRSSLESPATRRVVQEIILLCLVPQYNGTVAPSDPSARTALGALVGELSALGYSVRLGAAFTDESGQRIDGAQTSRLLSQPGYRDLVAKELRVVVASTGAAGVELDLQQLDANARLDVSDLGRRVATEMASVGKTMGVLAPPSSTSPSDIPGGDAFDLRTLATVASTIRLMTLDYSLPNVGPTMDPGWATDVYRYASANASGARFDVSYPLYGVEFSRRGTRFTTYLEAQGLRSLYGASISRGPTGAKFFAFQAPDGQTNQVWFDDADTTTQALAALAPALPPDVGVLFYGFGAEDPQLFSRISRQTP
jgi:spore germination protein YaaH